MRECANSPTAVQPTEGLNYIVMDGTKWRSARQVNDQIGFDKPGRVSDFARQYFDEKNVRVLRGKARVRASAILGTGPAPHMMVITDVVADAAGTLYEYECGERARNRESVALAKRSAAASPPATVAAPATDRLGLAQHVFEGHDVPTLTIAGKECWIASDVGRVLEYGRDGRGLVQAVGHDWKSEFVDGEHVLVAKGDILNEIREVALQIGHPDLQNPKLRHVTLLTRAGLWLVLDKTEKPVGQRFRRWLSGEVREAAEQGRAVATGMDGRALLGPVVEQMVLPGLGVDIATARETRLARREDHRHVEAMVRIQFDFAREVQVWDLTDPLRRDITRAVAKNMGLDLNGGGK